MIYVQLLCYYQPIDLPFWSFQFIHLTTVSQSINPFTYSSIRWSTVRTSCPLVRLSFFIEWQLPRRMVIFMLSVISMATEINDRNNNTQYLQKIEESNPELLSSGQDYYSPQDKTTKKNN